MQPLLRLDAELSRRVRVAEKPGLLRRAAAVLAHSGDSWFWLAGLILCWFLGNSYWRQRAVLMAGSIVATALLVFVVKNLVRRRRPAGEWGAIYRNTDPHSFPSGHAARAALLAVLAAGTGPVWWAALLLVWAPLVSLARAAMGVHYMSDVLAGIFFGSAAGVLILLIAW
jgi:undecaprenyl-diphosphatase